MIEVINDVKINYIDYGNSKGKPIVLLHGWGQNIDMMRPIGDKFQKEYRIIILDLPGYGNSEEPKYSWTVNDYCDAVHELLKRLKVKNPIMIGHSFGGKISLMYAGSHKVEKLILFGSPYKPEITKLSLKTKILKKLKQIPGLNKLENWAKKHIGSDDYRMATPRMREILVGTVNLDISEYVKKIDCPTLIIWGTLDNAVPLERAYELEKMIPNAGVVVYEGCTHYAYLERLGQTVSVLRSFLTSEE